MFRSARCAARLGVTTVLTDQTTFQAFYDHENVVVYERLPWHLIAGEERRWPRNQARLSTLLRDQIEWIVIKRSSHLSGKIPDAVEINPMPRPTG